MFYNTYHTNLQNYENTQRTCIRRTGGLRQRHQEQESGHHRFRRFGLDIQQVHYGEFQPAGKSRPSLKNFVGHISLSFAPEDTPKLSDKLMADIAKKYLRRMGIVNTQYIISRHHDKPHPHVHIVYNRVNNDGNAISGDQNFRKSARITQELTREYGLTFGKGKKKVNRDRQKGKDVIKYRIYDTVKGGLDVCIDWKELKDGLIAEGISVDFTYRTDSRIKGVVFTCDDISFGGYRIDRTMTYKNIDRKFQTNLEEYNRLIAAMKVSVQPHIAPVSGGGGGSDNDRGWRGEDEEKDRVVCSIPE